MFTCQHKDIFLKIYISKIRNRLNNTDYISIGELTRI